MGTTFPLSGDDNRRNFREAVVFKLVDGNVWASWPGTGAAVKLGRHDPVVAVMHDFLAHEALGERLEIRV
jgi:hypothetical protein